MTFIFSTHVQYLLLQNLPTSKIVEENSNDNLLQLVNFLYTGYQYVEHQVKNSDKSPANIPYK